MAGRRYPDLAAFRSELVGEFPDRLGNRVAAQFPQTFTQRSSLQPLCGERLGIHRARCGERGAEQIRLRIGALRATAAAAEVGLAGKQEFLQQIRAPEHIQSRQRILQRARAQFEGVMAVAVIARHLHREIAEEVESLAGSVSGFSGQDSFGLTGETVSWNFLPLFEIFSDILLHPTFPEEYVDKTRQDVLAAIKNQEDSLADLAFRLLWKTLYPCHPYGMDVLGTLESVKGITREGLADYYRKQAVSQNLVLAIVGDIDRFEAKEAAEGFLMGLRDEPLLRSIEPCDAPPGREAIQEVSAEKQQAHILVGARGARHSDPDKYSLDVLDAVIDTGTQRYVFVDELPKNATGKVLKRELRELLQR